MFSILGRLYYRPCMVQHRNVKSGKPQIDTMVLRFIPGALSWTRCSQSANVEIHLLCQYHLGSEFFFLSCTQLLLFFPPSFVLVDFLPVFCVLQQLNVGRGAAGSLSSLLRTGKDLKIDRKIKRAQPNHKP